jgi:hypothetical protein
MDPLITATARALAAGDPLGARNRAAVRDDTPARVLRGIAMAQLGDLVRAKAYKPARWVRFYSNAACAACLAMSIVD